ncbi:MAG: hypothetical protein COS65_25250 [Armatimonadetes bacterium CG06_land_8_20_14_3_00_66_21]|nr:MAG: hypothetical protein COS65_25250 [Armatimonadetes bacterium CG06_land_8_20_14_3_00_66_21]PIX49299.1 MAG: hypothetical protein COZ57_03770 [Armatimonadetes bacterium CG_4_8_14_3_um_filter_66_20]
MKTANVSPVAGVKLGSAASQADSHSSASVRMPSRLCAPAVRFSTRANFPASLVHTLFATDTDSSRADTDSYPSNADRSRANTDSCPSNTESQTSVLKTSLSNTDSRGANTQFSPCNRASSYSAVQPARW